MSGGLTHLEQLCLYCKHDPGMEAVEDKQKKSYIFVCNLYDEWQQCFLHDVLDYTNYFVCLMSEKDWLVGVKVTKPSKLGNRISSMQIWMLCKTVYCCEIMGQKGLVFMNKLLFCKIAIGTE